MSTLLVPWIVFPLVLLLLSLGCGLLAERATAHRLPGTLVLPVGFASVVVVSLFVTMIGAIAKVAAPAATAVAVVGVVVGVSGLRRRFDLWALAAAGGVFAVYAAPVVLSGSATFPGYVKLDDDSTFLANLDRVMEHGRSLGGLEPSSYLATLQPHLAKGYPLGAVMPVGVGRDLVGGESLWLYHPCVALTAAMLALALYELTRSIVPQPWLRALAAFVGAQSALLYGYALWGGLKEVAGAAAIALASALVWPALRGSPTPRTFLPLAIAASWLLGVLSSGAVLWLAPAIGTALFVTLVARPAHDGVRAVAGFAAFVVVLSLPTVVAAPSFLSNRIFEFDYLANLVQPLKAAQLAGIWPTGDFRFVPGHEAMTYALVVLVVMAAAAGVVWAVRRREWPVPVYAVGAIVSCFLFFPFVTPWIEGKALAMAAPAVPVAALAACAPLLLSGRRVEGIVLALLVSGGVLWSNVLQYHDVWLAPRGQLAELAGIGERFAGEGPALMTEFQPYGVRHLLRKLDAEGASELRIRPIPLRNGRLLPKGATANIDAFGPDALGVYRTLVLRRSPFESRPPSDYSLTWKGRWYEVWQRLRRTEGPVLEHIPLGSDTDPAAIPDCGEVDRLAMRAGSTGGVRAVVRPAAVVVPLSVTGAQTIEVPAAGRYGVWLAGSVRNRLQIAVDGRALPALRHHLDHAGYYVPLGEIDLGRGAHEVVVEYERGGLRPGSGGVEFPFGPLVLSTTTADAPMTTVSPAQARALCGKRLDWIEAVGEGS
jgi:hypothetical protein